MQCGSHHVRTSYPVHGRKSDESARKSIVLFPLQKKLAPGDDDDDDDAKAQRSRGSGSLAFVSRSTNFVRRVTAASHRQMLCGSVCASLICTGLKISEMRRYSLSRHIPARFFPSEVRIIRKSKPNIFDKLD